MILHRRELPVLSQEEIGKQLGLHVPIEDLRLLPHAFTDERASSGWGTRTQVEDFSLNSFFQRRDIPLVERYMDAESFPEKFTLWLEEQIALDSDIVAYYSQQMAWAGPTDYGHASLIEAADHDAVTVIDPAYLAPKLRDISPERLLTAMWSHGTSNRGGLWVISSTEPAPD